MIKIPFIRSFTGKSILVGLVLLIATASCNSAPAADPPGAETTVPEASPAITPSNSPTPAWTSLPSLTPTKTPTPSPTFTPSPSPTYAILRGEVLMRSNCRYGPGAPYLYKYGLVPGSNLEVIGRTDRGSWILVQAIGGNNPCWVKASLMDVKGDVMSVAPTYIPLPRSPYYRSPTGVSAVRNGEEVTVTWNPISLRAGDEQAAPPYVVEAWVCTDGQLVFTPVGSFYPIATIQDQPGCSEPSHARLTAAEKHGYTKFVDIPWPQAQSR